MYVCVDYTQREAVDGTLLAKTNVSQAPQEDGRLRLRPVCGGPDRFPGVLHRNVPVREDDTGSKVSPRPVLFSVLSTLHVAHISQLRPLRSRIQDTGERGSVSSWCAALGQFHTSRVRDIFVYCQPDKTFASVRHGAIESAPHNLDGCAMISGWMFNPWQVVQDERNAWLALHTFQLEVSLHFVEEVGKIHGRCLWH